MPWTAWWIVVASLATPGQSVGPMVLERDAYGRVSVEVGLGASGPYRFLIDTGASLSSIAPRVADRLGLPDAGRVRATSVGDEAVLALVRAPVIRLATRSLRVPWMVLLPASPSHPLAGFDGILGQDVLRQFDYLIDVVAGELWIDPPARALATIDLERLHQTSRSGPLSVADATGVRWTIDSGASHVVLFTDARARAGFVRLESALGSRRGTLMGAATVRLGRADVSWTAAVATEVAGRAERGLLPLELFDAIYVDNRRGSAHVVSRGAGKRGDPDVAADRRALEGDGGVVGRPRGVSHVAVR
jgi:predicted aspartyl protease